MLNYEAAQVVLRIAYSRPSVSGKNRKWGRAVTSGERALVKKERRFRALSFVLPEPTRRSSLGRIFDRPSDRELGTAYFKGRLDLIILKEEVIYILIYYFCLQTLGEIFDISPDMRDSLRGSLRNP